MDTAQLVIYEDNVRQQVAGAHGRQIRLRDPVQPMVAGPISQGCGYVVAGIFRDANE
jgi:hypothetical protein